MLANINSVTISSWQSPVNFRTDADFVSNNVLKSPTNDIGAKIAQSWTQRKLDSDNFGYRYPAAFIGRVLSAQLPKAITKQHGFEKIIIDGISHKSIYSLRTGGLRRTVLSS